MKNKVLLLGFSTNFNTHQAFDIAINELMSKYPNSLASFSLNTRVHAITKIDGKTQLLDTYHIRGMDKVFTKWISGLRPENPVPSSKKIWDSRKDLGQLVIRVG